MTEKQRRLAELEAQLAQLIKKRDRLDSISDADEVSGYSLHKLLMNITSVETEIIELQRELHPAFDTTNSITCASIQSSKHDGTGPIVDNMGIGAY